VLLTTGIKKTELWMMTLAEVVAAVIVLEVIVVVIQ
jgi:hypothetical protein